MQIIQSGYSRKAALSKKSVPWRQLTFTQSRLDLCGCAVKTTDSAILSALQHVSWQSQRLENWIWTLHSRAALQPKMKGSRGKNDLRIWRRRSHLDYVILTISIHRIAVGVITFCCCIHLHFFPTAARVIQCEKSGLEPQRMSCVALYLGLQELANLGSTNRCAEPEELGSLTS